MSINVGHDVSEPNAQESALSQDVAFEMLSSRRRRYVIHALKQHDGAVAFRPLVEQVAAWENGLQPSAVSYEQRMRVYTALRQSHLPKLDANGIVSYDADRGTVALTDAASELEVYLEVVPHQEISWSKFYAGLGVLSLGLVWGTWLELVPFSFVPPLAGAFGIALSVTVSAIFHIRYDRRMRLGSEGAPPEMEGDRWQ